MKKSPNLRKRRLLWLAAALMVCVVFAGCGGKEAALDETSSMDTTENTEMLILEEPVTEAPGDIISTPVGDLEFPGEWAGRIRVEDKSADGLYAADLYGTVGQQEALLFSIYMGQTDIGYYFGAAPNAQGEMLEIRIEIEDFQSDGTWSENAVNEVRDMQSRVNDLIAQLHELPGFVTDNVPSSVG